MTMKNLLLLYLLISPAVLAMGKPLESRSSAAIEGVRIVSNGDKTKIEVKLSETINPRVVIATNPDRLV